MKRPVSSISNVSDTISSRLKRNRSSQPLYPEENASDVENDSTMLGGQENSIKSVSQYSKEASTKHSIKSSNKNSNGSQNASLRSKISFSSLSSNQNRKNMPAINEQSQHEDKDLESTDRAVVDSVVSRTSTTKKLPLTQIQNSTNAGITCTSNQVQPRPTAEVLEWLRELFDLLNSNMAFQNDERSLSKIGEDLGLDETSLITVAARTPQKSALKLFRLLYPTISSRASCKSISQIPSAVLDNIYLYTRTLHPNLNFKMIDMRRAIGTSIRTAKHEIRKMGYQQHDKREELQYDDSLDPDETQDEIENYMNNTDIERSTSDTASFHHDQNLDKDEDDEEVQDLTIDEELDDEEEDEF
ncbi:unnamed protein product [Rotaria sp. Silwood2]|nr:unnamed protein product [Rotaria sp. Silwood2]CAF4124228.1 unnamed protein product [Rotaria sp. Silwood2]CAF4384410.1 unnamed protein product [Rotaria sp. Silwood2]